MVRERIADNVYVFTSERYAQVNAGAVVGPSWSIVIDTLPFPEETLEIKDFLETKLGAPVRYVVLTHYHADHALGAFCYPEARIIAHSECRRLLATRGQQRLDRAREQTRELESVRLVLPDVVFESGSLLLRAGKRTLQLLPLPGHSPDGIGALVVEDRVLFSGDAMMPLPYLVDGDYEAAVASLKRIPRLKLENVVQGHGEVILRGEIQNAVRANLHYLANLHKHVQKAIHRRDGDSYLASIDIEDCGKSRILLGGLADELHRRNLMALYQQMRG